MPKMSPLLNVKFLVFLFLWNTPWIILFAATHPLCNGDCGTLNGVDVEVCLFSSERIENFDSCCTPPNLCEWLNFTNYSEGPSFFWSLYHHHYGEYNCVNSSNNNTVVQTVLVLPMNMTVHCPNCLSITACTFRTPHYGLRLSGSFQFNKQFLDGTSCNVKIGNDNIIGSVLQLPHTIQLSDDVDLYSVYIQCQLCESTYYLNYYLTGSITDCPPLPQPTTTLSEISTFSHSQLSTFGYSTTASHNDAIISITTQMSAVSQTHTPNMTSILSIPAGAITPGKSNSNDDNTPNIGAVVGGVIGGLLIISLIAIIICACCWKCCQKKPHNPTDQNPDEQQQNDEHLPLQAID